MKTKLIQIGNSKGVRLPKALIEQAQLNGAVEMELRGKEIVLRSTKRPRAGWEKAIAAAIKKHGHDVDEDFLALPNDFDEKDWTW